MSEDFKESTGTISYDHYLVLQGEFNERNPVVADYVKEVEQLKSEIESLKASCHLKIRYIKDLEGKNERLMDLLKSFIGCEEELLKAIQEARAALQGK